MQELLLESFAGFRAELRSLLSGSNPDRSLYCPHVTDCIGELYLPGLEDSPAPRFGKSTTIGLMLDWVGDPYHDAVMGGVVEAAAAANVNVFSFVGGQLPSNPAEGARHRVFDLIGPSSVDAVALLTTSIMHQVGRTGVEAYCKERFRNLRYYSIGAALEGAPFVAPNNQGAIEEVVEHLVRVHGARRIALLRGPLANEEAERRYQAYVDSLQWHELLFEPKLVAVGNFLMSGAREAIKQFAQLPGMRLEDLDAIVASNDSMAIGALAALEERGITVPDKVALTGFDDVEEAQLTSAPLTTVRQPLSQLGSQAVRDLVRWVQVGTAPESRQIDTELVVRRSCGCSHATRNAVHSIIPQIDHGFQAALVMRRQHILDTMTRTARGRLGGVGSDWQPKLLNAFVAEIRGEQPGAFGGMLEEFARRLIVRHADIQVCHDIADLLRRQLCGTMRSDPALRDQAEDIFYAAHLSLSATAQRDLSRDKLQLRRWVMGVSSTCNAIISAFDLGDWRQRIREGFPRIGIETYFIVEYAPNRGFEDARLLVGAQKGQDVAAEASGHFDATLLLPRAVRQSLPTGSVFAVMPLTWKSQSLGHALFEYHLDNASSYNLLAEAIGIGLQGVHFAERR